MDQLKRFGEGIWNADGPHVRVWIADLPTRMTIVELANGSLWVNSPVDVAHEVLEQIVALGSVRFLVAPTPLHVWRLARWHALFPDAQRWGPPRRRRDPPDDGFAGSLRDEPPAAWAEDIDQVVLRGNVFIDEVAFLHRRSRTLMVTDFIQNYPAREGAFFTNHLKALAGVLDGGVPLDIRLSFLNRRLARHSVERILTWDFDKLIVAHGACVPRDAKEFVTRAFRWLLRG